MSNLLLKVVASWPWVTSREQCRLQLPIFLHMPLKRHSGDVCNKTAICQWFCHLSIIHSVDLSIIHSVILSIIHSVDLSIICSVDLSIIHSVKGLSIIHLMILSINQMILVNHSFSWSVNHSFIQLIYLSNIDSTVHSIIIQSIIIVIIVNFSNDYYIVKWIIKRRSIS